jgi:hypothetical protein
MLTRAEFRRSSLGPPVAYPRIERVADRLFKGEEAVLTRDRMHRGAPGSPGRRNVTLGGRATSGRPRVQTNFLSNPFPPRGTG